jgi:hypothetical protein
MLRPDFNPEPVAVRIFHCGYVIKCKARSCLKRATVVAEKVDHAGRHAGQLELCDRHCDFVIARESGRGLEISDRRQDRAPS